MNNVGEIIKAARIKKGYTQEELGKMLGVQKSAIAKYEKGRVVNIKRSSLAAMSKILDIPPADLIGEIEDAPIKSANELADVFLDPELKSMIREYNSLDDSKKKDIRDYVHFIWQRSTSTQNSIQKSKDK